ncbi:MAG: glycosyl transferase family 4 [Desulfurococcales archaeon]|nr:glycosyl transferase family 4 [Desulfurococcales archaeon]
MMLITTSLISALTAVITAMLVSAWIPLAQRLGITGRDMNKPGKPIKARAGGFWALLGITFGLLLLCGFYAWNNALTYVSQIYALALLALLGGVLGFLDDMLGWKKGLPARYRILAAAVIAAPLSVVAINRSSVFIPFLGDVQFGMLYPLVLVPLGVMGAANGFNMLAGYNGLEAGLALILFASTGILGLLDGNVLIVQSAMILGAALVGFLIYNWYPAKTFPGNSFTYGIGGLYAGLVVIGGYEVAGVVMFAMFFVEFILFIRGLKHGIYKENFGIPNGEGCLGEPYEEAYSVTHIAIRALQRIRGCATEKWVVYLILCIQLLISTVVITAVYIYG